MLYESYFSYSMSECSNNNRANDHTAVVQQSLIGITQPRRVAAISTAKRVNYEMGFGNHDNTSNNNIISNPNNVVSYQTRYESAGLGSDTHIKFMTDGILLQEIQHDLLLRKYSVIILDEAHERNLNTDCLIGLLSVTIPLRKQASMEEAEEAAATNHKKIGQPHDQEDKSSSTPSVLLQPLKIVIMSATLRIEDFTSNKNLFPSSNTKTTIVKVPGRTHPVTVHHNKVTELDDYGK
jgi:ATP-dependent RNA helicase DHX37/DHR1